MTDPRVPAAEVTEPADELASVTVLLDPSLGHRAPLEAAARLARAYGAKLSALVINNPDFDAVASLPFTRELRLSSSSLDAFNPHDVVGDFAGQLKRIERLLRGLAVEFDVPYQLTQRRARFTQALDQLSQHRGLVVVDRPPQIPVHQRRRYRQVIAVFDGNPRVLQVGAGLARANNALLEVLILADGAEGFRERRAAAEALLDGTAVQWRYQALPAQTKDAPVMLADRLVMDTRHVQSLVVVPSGSSVCPPGQQLSRLTAATIVLVP